MSAKHRIDEYKIASAEARYRDQMLFTSFYLSLVALAVLLRVVIGLYNQQRFVAALIVSLVAAIGFASLLWWAYATKHARNRAWGRRGEIEKMLPSFKLNEYLAENSVYSFRHEETKPQKRIIGNSSSDFIIIFAAVVTLGWVGAASSTVVVLITGGSIAVELLVSVGMVTGWIVLILYTVLNHAMIATKRKPASE